MGPMRSIQMFLKYVAVECGLISMRVFCLFSKVIEFVVRDSCAAGRFEPEPITLTTIPDQFSLCLSSRVGLGIVVERARVGGFFWADPA